jgi:hypothetical protein
MACAEEAIAADRLTADGLMPPRGKSAPSNMAAGVAGIATGVAVTGVCAVGVGEVDLAAHCFLARGAVVTAGVILLTADGDD